MKATRAEFEEALEALVKKGKVLRVWDPAKGDFTYWAVPEDDDDLVDEYKPGALNSLDSPSDSNPSLGSRRGN